jgi:Tol biopolymer transport system component
MDVLQLSGNDISAVGARWHPDGQRLLIQRLFPDGKLSLWWVASDASSAEELASPPALYNNLEGWPIAPDGRKIVYGATVDGRSQLFEFDLNTRQPRQLTFSPDDKFNAVFSRDSRWLVYVSNANGSNQLWRMPASGGQAEPLTKGEDRVRHMFYSPDGRWLYFQPNHLNIYRMPAVGGAGRASYPFSRVRALSRGANYHSRWAIPCVLPQQRWIVTLGASTRKCSSIRPMMLQR